MPQLFRSAVLTNDGISVLNRAIAGECEMQFVSIAVGDGIYEGDERSFNYLQSRHALKSLKQEVALNSVHIVSEKSVRLRANITNRELEIGYYMNEMGLYVQEKDNSETKVLYSIAIIKDGIEVGDFMPPYDGTNPASILQEYYATVNSAENVTIEISDGQYVLTEDFEEYKTETGEELTALEHFIRAGIFGFIYEEGMELVQNYVGCRLGVDDETIYIPTELAELKSDDTLELLQGTGLQPFIPGGGGYVLPAATQTRLGGVKIGNGINVASDGTISVDMESISEDISEEAADIVERNATSPSDEDIDDLWEGYEDDASGEGGGIDTDDES